MRISDWSSDVCSSDLDNENVNSAFEMVGPAEANIDSLTAGCNTNNVVEINKNDIRGLVNLNPGGYDTDEFQANIDRKSVVEGKRVSERVNLGGGRSIKKKKKKNNDILRQITTP